MRYLAIALVLLACAIPASACPNVFTVASAPAVSFQSGGCGQVFSQAAPVQFFQAAPVASFTPVALFTPVVAQQVVVQKQVVVKQVVQRQFRTPVRNFLFGH